MHDNNFVTAWLRLAFTPKVGSKTFEKLLKKFGNPILVLENLTEIKRRYKLDLTPPALAEVEDSIAKCYAFGGEIILACDDVSYPMILKEIEGYPPVLFAKGNTQLLKRNKIAIVGTRNSSINGENITRKIASDLGKNGLVVVSGLARGIDAAAHYGSLESGTIGVVASGINCIYPKENTQLQNLLYEKGLVISENQMDALPVSKNFPRRNRIISGISTGVLVIEAMQRSGTMITADYALEQGRDVFAVPGSPTDPRAYGTNLLIKTGAVLVRDAQDILCEMNIATSQIKSKEEPLEQYFTDNSSEQSIIGKLSNVPTDIEEVFSNSRMSLQDFNKTVIDLEITGKIIRQGNKLFIK
jgi:DNA processing protein